jgi:hypothetical protein
MPLPGETLRFDDALNCRDLAPIEALSGAISPWKRWRARPWRRFGFGSALPICHFTRSAMPGCGYHPRRPGPAARAAFANVSYAPDPEEGVRAIEQALVCLNPHHGWKVGFDGNEDVYDIRYTLIHEIGHAIGLDHPGPSGQVMAFRYTEAFNDLQPGDLRGVQRLYGRAADDGGPADDFDIHLAGKPNEAQRANHLIGHSVMSTAEEQEIVSISDPVVDQDGSMVPVIGADGVLGIGEK